MFVGCVLAFIVGIYIEAACSFALKLPLLGLLITLLALPLLRWKNRSITSCLLILAFLLAGTVRLALLTGPALMPVDDVDSLYAGTVVETSQRIKVVKLSEPVQAASVRVTFATNADLQTGDYVYVIGRLREFSPSGQAPPRRLWQRLKQLEGINHEIRGKLVLVRPGTSPINNLRNYFRTKIEDSGAREDGILKALTIGDRSSIDEERNSLFLRTGTSHVLAISGFNVGIISGFFFFVARSALRINRRLKLSGRDVKYAAALTIPFPFIFMLIAGSGVSVIRATIMIVIYMFALLFERGRHVMNTMALSALVILLIYPHSLFTASFQLTFMSLLAILLCMEKLYPAIRRVKPKPMAWTLSVVATTAAATLGTAPVVLYHFYGINLVSIIHNLVTVPLTGVLATSLSLIGMSIPFGNILLVLSGEIVHLNILLLRFLDWGYMFPVVRPDLYEALLYYALFFSLLYVQRRPVRALVLCVLVPLCLVHAYKLYDDRFRNDFCAYFIDVGMGEAALIEAPKGVRILIDGGGSYSGDFDTGSRIVMPFLLSRKILTLDYVINSHIHADHIGGLSSIIRYLRVKRFAGSAYLGEHPEFASLSRLLRERNTALELWKKGDVYQPAHRTEAAVFHPPPNATFEHLNNSSLVIRITYERGAFLFPGDIDEEVEYALLRSGAPLKSDVLKVPHHGSRTSSSLPFLGAVGPVLAILTGGGMQNVPSLETLERYRTLSIPVLRTDRQGPIAVCFHNGTITYKTGQR